MTRGTSPCAGGRERTLVRSVRVCRIRHARPIVDRGLREARAPTRSTRESAGRTRPCDRDGRAPKPRALVPFPRKIPLRGRYFGIRDRATGPLVGMAGERFNRWARWSPARSGYARTCAGAVTAPLSRCIWHVRRSPVGKCPSSPCSRRILRDRSTPVWDSASAETLGCSSGGARKERRETGWVRLASRY